MPGEFGSSSLGTGSANCQVNLTVLSSELESEISEVKSVIRIGNIAYKSVSESALSPDGSRTCVERSICSIRSHSNSVSGAVLVSYSFEL